MKNCALRGIPQTGRMLEMDAFAELAVQFGRDRAAEALRATVEAWRHAIKASPTDLPPPTPDALLDETRRALSRDEEPNLKPAVNATGILLHTGLGRAPMPSAAREAVLRCMGCCNLQMDMGDGSRIHREHAIRDLVCSLTGAEDVALVNNNAAATLLVLAALVPGREVVVSRGELIEIGGSFRLPDIMAQSGAKLREVGTTNKTHLRDYEQAIGPATALLMKVHKSNYGMVGFTKEVGIAEIAAAGHARGIAVADDLGCGAMMPLERFGLPHEMTIAESLAAGADLVLASTDKLIGGPQGGLVVGKAALVAKVRQHPLYRAFRVCKMTAAALEATLRLFKSPDTIAQTHPLYAMLDKPPEAIRAQAEALAARLRPILAPRAVEVVPHEAFLGGGSVPAEPLPSFAVAIASDKADDLARALRACRVPVCPRIHDSAVYLDMRTVSEAECDLVAESFREIAGSAS